MGKFRARQSHADISNLGVPRRRLQSEPGRTNPGGDTSTALLSCSAEFLAPYATPIVDEVVACFEEPCESVVACLDDVL